MSGNFSAALCRLYDTAIDETLWRESLDLTVRHVGALSAGLIAVDQGSQRPYNLMALSGAFDRLGDGAREYVETLSHLEADSLPFVQARVPMTVISDSEVWPTIQSPTDRADYRYLHERMGVFRRLISRVSDNDRWFDCLTLQFDSRFQSIPTGCTARMAELVPHVGKVLELSRINQQLKARYQAVLGVLDKVDLGICLCIGGSDIVVANREAERILDGRDGLQRIAGRLTCNDPALSSELSDAIGRLVETASGTCSDVSHVLVVEKRSGVGHYVVEVSALRDSDAEIETGFAGALVMILDSEKPLVVDVDVLARLYGLSAVERDVCEHLLAGRTTADIAEIRGVAASTIKTQLTSIRAKTLTDTRLELMRLAIRVSPPVDLG